jgi:hypothetical protein
MTDLATLYQTDYAAWAQRNAELLRERRFSELDIEHLLEMISILLQLDSRADSARGWIARGGLAGGGRVKS